MRLVLILLVFWPLHTSIKNIDAMSFAQNGIEGFYQVDQVLDMPVASQVEAVKRVPSSESKDCLDSKVDNTDCLIQK